MYNGVLIQNIFEFENKISKRNYMKVSDLFSFSIIIANNFKIIDQK